MTVIVEPVEMAVSLDDARISARANGTDLDGQIEIAVRAITVDAETETRRAIINRTHRITLDTFPAAIRIPQSPVVSALSVKYLDLNGVEQTLDPADYYLDRASEPGYIVPAYGKAWPSTFGRINAVTADVVCGYGPDHTTTPAAFKGYILARVQERFAPAGTAESPFLIRGLDSLKVYA
jgi:uncharacterized phiE125 gp8 family phage protein